MHEKHGGEEGLTNVMYRETWGATCAMAADSTIPMVVERLSAGIVCAYLCWCLSCSPYLGLLFFLQSPSSLRCLGGTGTGLPGRSDMMQVCGCWYDVWSPMPEFFGSITPWGPAIWLWGGVNIYQIYLLFRIDTGGGGGNKYDPWKIYFKYFIDFFARDACCCETIPWLRETIKTQVVFTVWLPGCGFIPFCRQHIPGFLPPLLFSSASRHCSSFPVNLFGKILF